MLISRLKFALLTALILLTAYALIFDVRSRYTADMYVPYVSNFKSASVLSATGRLWFKVQLTSAAPYSNIEGWKYLGLSHPDQPQKLMPKNDVAGFLANHRTVAGRSPVNGNWLTMQVYELMIPINAIELSLSLTALLLTFGKRFWRFVVRRIFIDEDEPLFVV